MQGYERYAIYYAPEARDALGAFGNHWLGYDPETGTELKRPELDGGTDGELAVLTKSPSRYGFHGTIKPPFALHPDFNISDLDLALQAFAGQLAPIEMGPLVLKQIGRFLCLCPTAPYEGLNDLAARTVQELDCFRGAQSEAQMAKRRARGLTERQESYLQQYGYPYVMEEFCFHLTLTDNLDKEELVRLQNVLRQLTNPYTKRSFQIRELCLFADPGEGRPFRLLRRYTLTGCSQ